MCPRTRQYSLLAVSKFITHVVEFDILGEDTVFQKLYLLKSHDAIQTAIVVPPQSNHLCQVIIASGTTLWRIYLPDENKDIADGSFRPAKRAKFDEATNSDEDIFADLLGQKQRPSMAAINSFQSEPSTQKNVFSLSLCEKHLLCGLDTEIIDISAFDELLVALVADKDVVYIKVFHLAEEKVRCAQTIDTGIKATLFNPDFTSNSAKRLYLVVNQHEANEAEAENGYDTTQIITLPLNLFTLLFGRLAACFRSPVVLLCDIKGCIYFINIKLQEPKLRRPVVLCEANSRIVCISRVELGILPSEGALRNRDAISLLETALGNVKNGESQTHALSLTGLLMVSETGQCYVFLPIDVTTEVLMFTLSNSCLSCTVKRNHLIYSTGSSIEMCDLALTEQEKDSINVIVETKFSLCKKGVTHLISLTKGKVIIGVTDELKLIHVPSTENEPMQVAIADQNMLSQVNSSLSLIPCFSEDLRVAHDLIDSCLLQLNLFASIVKQQRSTYVPGQSESEETVVTCECSVTSKPDVPVISLQIKLTSNTSVPFSKDWRVDIAVCQKEGKISTAPVHHVFPFSQELSPKSTKEMYIPISGPSSLNLQPYHITVSLVLTLDVAFTTIAKWPSDVGETLIVEIHKQVFDALDCLKLVCSNVPVTSGTGADCILWRALQSTSNRPQLAKCLLTMPRVCTDKTVGGGLKQVGNSATFTLAIGVADRLCKDFDLQAKEDVIKLLLSLPQVRSTEACVVTKSQIQLKTPADNVPVYLTVSSDLVPESDAARKNQKIFAFMVTLRSPNLALLMAIRASTKARLECHLRKASKSEAIPSSRVKLNQQLLCFKRLAEEAMKHSSSKSFHEGNFIEKVNSLCDLFDRCELIN